MAQQLLPYASVAPNAAFTIDPAPPAPPFLNIEADFEQAYNVTSFALQRAAIADGFIAQLGSLAAALVPPTINPTFPTNLNPPAISTPTPPSILPITYSAPPVPAPFAGTLAVNTSFPTFDALEPTLVFPNAPVASIGALPSSPAINLNFAYPTVDVTLPQPPSLLSINVQAFDGVTFPVFDMDSPVLTLAAPQIVNYVAGAPYTDSLLSGLLGTLEDRLGLPTGQATGLPAAVEENIWNRGREREYRQLADKLADLDRMEAMGYALPPGAYVDARIKLNTDFTYTVAGLSRDVMIKQAELEQSNIQKSMELAVSIESKLIDYANQRDQRNFDACRYATEAGVSIYNAGVQAFAVRVNAYRAAVDVYTAQIAGARAQVEIYQAEIAAEKLKIEANAEVIQNYKVMVDAALASIEVFKGEIQLVQTQAQIENLKVSIFGEQVKAYAAQVGVYTAEVEAYKAVISAEQTKEQVYGTQAQVYGTLVDAQFKGITAQIDAFKALLSEKEEEYTAYRALVESEAENVKAIAAANSSTADIYRAEVQGTSSYNDALIKEFETQNTLATQIATIGVSAAQAQGNLYLTAKSIATDAAKVGATIESQIAASALGAVTFATHRSRQDSAGYSISQSFGQSKSQGNSTGTNTNTNTSNTINQSSSQAYQVSTSNSTSTVHQIQSVE